MDKNWGASTSLLVFALLGKEGGVDVGQHSSRGDGDSSQQSAQLFVVAHCQLNVARHNARSLVVASRVAGQLQNFGRQILEHGGQIHGSSGSHALRIAALAQMPMNSGQKKTKFKTTKKKRFLRQKRLFFLPSDGKLETSAVGSRSALSSALLSLSLSSFGAR